MTDELMHLVKNATSGKRTPVRRFLNGLKESSVLVPIHSPDSDTVSSEGKSGSHKEVSVEGEGKLRPRILKTEAGVPFLPLFTHLSFLEAFRDRMSEGDSSFQFEQCELPGPDGLKLANRLRERGVIDGIIFNMYQKTEVKVFNEEVKQLANDKAVPLKQQLLGEDVGEGNMHVVPPPQTTVPDAFTETIREYVRDQPELESSDWVWGLNPEVDNRPHLIVNLETCGNEVEHEKHVKQLNQILEGSIPDPGFIEVVFDKSWG